MAKTKIETVDISNDDSDQELDEDLLEDLYGWVDKLPLSRPKKNIARDFSDGVPVAEMLNKYFPQLVYMPYFTKANSYQRKVTNWNNLNRLNVHNQTERPKPASNLSPQCIESVVHCQPGCIEKVLAKLRTKIEHAMWELKRNQAQEKQVHTQEQVHVRGRGGGKAQRHSDKPEADQNMPSVSPRRKGNQAHASTFQQQKKGSHGYDNSETVSKLLVEEKEQEILARNETILILKAKVERCEHLLHLKDMRIEDLQRQLERLRPTGYKG